MCDFIPLSSMFGLLEQPVVERTSSDVSQAACELYEGAFFNPAHAIRMERTADPPKSMLPMARDTARQFMQFEKSVFKMDRLLSRKNLNKYRSLPLASSAGDLLAPDAVEIGEKHNWMEEVVTAVNARKKTDWARVRISTVLRKACLVPAERADAIQAEVDDCLAARKQAATPAVMAAAASTPAAASAVTGLPDLQADEVRLLNRSQLQFLLDCGGVAAGATRFSLEKAACRLLALKPRPPRGDEARAKAAPSWTDDDDTELCGMVDSVQRRRRGAFQAFRRWAGSSAALGDEAADADVVWAAVAREVGRTPSACHRRYVILQRRLL